MSNTFSGHYPIEHRSGEIERLLTQSKAMAPDTLTMLERIGPMQGWTCLDIGCGPGGITDLLLMRVVDALLAFPGLILAIAIVAALGPGLRNAMIAIGIVAIPLYARLVRASVLQLKQMDFVLATRSIGASPLRIVLRHLIPNLLNPIIVQASLSAGFAILAEATLSFLGLGAQLPTPDWGQMINAGASFLTNDPWLAIVPGAAISITVYSFNLLGDSLRDALDPRLRS